MSFILFICFLNATTQRSVTQPGYQQGIWRQIKMRVAEPMTEDAGIVSSTRNPLFADTETGENAAQQVIGGKFTGDLTQRLLRQAQFLGQQLPCVSAH